jgi:hypothetical protein
MFLYGPGLDEQDRRPIFAIEDAAFSVAGLREIVFGGHAYFTKIQERRGSETRRLGSETEGGWIGWALYSGWPPPKSNSERSNQTSR